jgi:hypothetical protein
MQPRLTPSIAYLNERIGLLIIPMNKIVMMHLMLLVVKLRYDDINEDHLSYIAASNPRLG